MSIDLEAIKRRADAATPGPWDRAWYSAQGDGMCDCAKKGALLHTYPADDDRFKTYHIHESSRHEDDHELTSLATFETVAGKYDYEEGGIIADADAEFVAHARQDIPALVAEIESLVAALITAGSFIGRDCPEAERAEVLDLINTTLDG